MEIKRSARIIAIQADPIETFSLNTDTTWLIAREFASRNYQLFFDTPQDMNYEGDSISATGHIIEAVPLDPMQYIKIRQLRLDLQSAQVILIRQNPPFDMEYITSTYLLEMLMGKVLILNNPASIRNYPEKLLPLRFPDLTPPTLIASRYSDDVAKFTSLYEKVVLKPLYSFGGAGVQRISAKIGNISNIIKNEKYGPFVLQEYLPAVERGDKRIMLLDGEILGALWRSPQPGEFRTNLAVGGNASRCDIDECDIKICNALGKFLKESGLFLAGVDIIDGKLIEINTTSPTGLTAINRIYNKKVEVEIVNQIESKVRYML